MGEILELQSLLADFAAERAWEKFHTPKNLVMALVGEIGELAELFQWLTPEQASEIMSGAKADHVREEVADVFGYILRLADVLNIDLDEALRAKIDSNAAKYPADVVWGRAIKYTDLQGDQ